MKKTKLSLIIFLLVVTILLTTQSISASDHNKSTDAIKKDYKTQSTTKIQSKTSTNNLKKDTKTITNTTNYNYNKKSITKKDTTKNTKRTITPEETSSEVIYTTDDLKDLPTINENLKNYDNEVNATVKLETGNYNFEGISSTSLLRLTDYAKIRNVTFDGQGSTIDLSQAPDQLYNNEIFQVSNDYSLTINNVTLKDFKRESHDGSIILNSGNLTIKNSNFYDNQNIFRGSNFNNYIGESVVLRLNANTNNSIYNSNFKNNSAGRSGAVISVEMDYNNNKLFINNSNFTDNKVLRTSDNGGVMSLNGESTLFVNNSLFKNNSAPYNGGVVYQGVNSEITVYNSKFEENQAREGGVFYQDKYGRISLYNSNFTSNNASENGGVLNQRGVIIINACNFTSNQAKGSVGGGGGVIYCDSRDRTDTGITIKNSNFLSNSVISGNGGVIYDYTECDYCPLIINNTLFKQNSAIDGGVIYRNNKAITLIENSTFDSNNATNAGAISVKTHGYVTEMTLNNVTMNNNNATQNGGLFCIDKETILNVYNSTLNGSIGSSVIYNQGKLNLTHNNITNNSVTSTNYVLYNAANANIIIEDNVFINNTDNTRDMLLNNDTGRTYNVADNNLYIDNYLEDSIESINPIVIDDETEKTVKIKINLRSVYNNTIVNGTIILSDENGIELKREDVTNGICNLELPLSQLSKGVNNLNVTYETLSKHYQNRTAKMQVTILKNTTISIDVTNPVYVRNETVIKITLKDEDGNLLDNKNVNVTINGVLETYTTSNGIIEITKTFGTNGTVNIVANFTGDSVYKPSNNTTSINVLKHSTLIILEVPESIRLGEEVTITATLIDTTINKAIQGEHINLKTNGTNRGARTTNQNGKISYKYTPKYMGIVKVLAEHFAVDKEFYYEAEDVTATFIVKEPLIPTIITVEASDTKINKTNKITIHLTTNNSQNLDKQVTVTIDSEQFYITTSNGMATITNYTSTSARTVRVSIEFAGDEDYKKSNNSTSFAVNRLQTNILLDNIQSSKVGSYVNIKGKLLDENGKIVSNVEVSISLNDKNYEVTTDDNGVFTKSVKTSIVGTNNVSVGYEGSSIYTGSSNKTTFKVVQLKTKININNINTLTLGKEAKISGKLLDENNNLISNVKITLKINDESYEIKTDDKGAFTKTIKATVVGSNNVSSSYAGSSIYIGCSNKTTFKVEALKTKIKTNSISTVTVGLNAKISGKLLDENNNAVANAKITITVEGKTYTATTGKDGSFSISHKTTTSGKIDVKINYPGNKNYKSTNTTTSFKVKKKVHLKVNNLTGIIGEKITFTATLTDDNGNKVNDGTLIFKLNGVSLNTKKRFDNSSNTPYKCSVKNGKTSVTIIADKYLRKGGNITATYNGTTEYGSVNSEKAKLTIKLRNMKITLKAQPSKVKQYKDIKFTATVTDVTKNSKNKTAIKENSYILFKIDGKIIKVNGKKANVTVKSNKIVYKYTIPKTTPGIRVDRRIRNYNLTATYKSNLFYMKNNTNSTKYNVLRSKITIKISKATLKNNKLSIKGTIKDYMKNYLVGTNKVCLKIDGSTYNVKGKIKYFNVKNGKINLKNIKINYPYEIKKVSVVSGDRVAYLGGKSKAKKIVKQ